MNTTLGHSDALIYFEVDADTLEYLSRLTEDEIENFNMAVKIYPDTKGAQYTFGHASKNSEHLAQFGNGINNTTWEDDDYDGVMEWAKENNIEWDV